MSYELTVVPRQPAPVSFAGRLMDSIRSYTLGPHNIADKAIAPYYSNRSTAGPMVNEFTAFLVSAWYDGINQLSSDVAKMPCNLMIRRQNGGAVPFEASRTFKLLKYSPNPEMRSMVFRRTLMTNALVYGNGYAEIERDGAQRPFWLWHLESNRVQPFTDTGMILDGRESPLRYRIDGKDVLETKDVIHLQGLSLNGIQGLNLVWLAREILGLALASQQFAAAYFGQGTRFGGVLSSELQDLDPEQKEEIRAEIEKLHQSAEKAFRILVLGAGFKFTETGSSMSESQMIELRDQCVADIARYLNMPVSRLKVNRPGAVSYASVEMANLEYYQGPILTWATLLEEEFTAKLVPSLEWGIQYVKHNAKVFLRGDTAARTAWYTAMVNLGIYNANKVLELEDENPQEGDQGELYLVNGAQVPKQKLMELADANIDATEAKAEQARRPPPEPKPAVASNGPTQQQVDQANERVRVAEALALEARSEADAAIAALATAEDSGLATAAELAEKVRTELDLIGRANLAEEAAAESRAAAEALSVAQAALSVELTTAQQAAREAEERAQEGEAAAEARIAERLVAVQAAEDAEQRALAAQAQAQAFEQAASEAVQAQAVEATQRAEVERRGLEARAEAERAAAEAATALQAAQEASLREREALVLAERLRQQVADLEAARANDDVAMRERDHAYAEGQAAVQTRIETLERQVLGLDGERQAAQAAAALHRTRAEELERAVAELSAHLTEARGSHSTAVQALETAVQALERDLQETRGLVEGAAAEAREAAALAQAREAELRALLAKESAGLAAEVAAHRVLVLATSSRMLDYESGRLARAAASEAKLRSWLESFYGDFEDLFCRALAKDGVMATHLAFIRSPEDPEEVARRFVRQHISESTRQVRAVLDDDQADLGTGVQRLIRRWEQDRAAVIADALMQKELEYARRR